MNFTDLCKIEPKLEEILRTASSFQSRPGFCANAVFYSGLKRKLEELVGWDRVADKNPLLTSAKAYDTAYDIIYGALPDCQHEGLC